MTNKDISHALIERGLDPNINGRLGNVENTIVEKLTSNQNLSLYEWAYMFSILIHLPVKILMMTTIIMLPLTIILSYFIITPWFLLLTAFIMSNNIIYLYYAPLAGIVISVIDTPLLIVIGLLHWVRFI